MATIFISYSHVDDVLREQLEKHLTILKRQKVIDTWFDGRIGAGMNIDAAIREQLQNCEIVLLLISPDFLASDYCYDTEMTQAMARHERGEAIIIPVILRPCDWKHPPFKDLKAVPKDGLAITRWPDRDEALLDVVQAIRAAARRIESTAPLVPAVTEPTAPLAEWAPEIEVDESWAELSPAQARRFLEPCGDKIRMALKSILKQEPNGFVLSEVFKAVGADWETEDLRGVWGGMTKRVRTVLGDPNAYLIDWSQTDDDWIGRLTPTSHVSLRKAMGL